MMLSLIFSLILTFIPNVISQGVCTNSDLTINLNKGNIYGTKKGGFSINCEYTVTGSYDLYIWRIDKENGATLDAVFTYFTGTNPPTSQLGPNYIDRQIKFENNNTIVFGSMHSSDTGTYKCTVQFNAAAAECTESSSLKLIAKPVISYQEHCLPRGNEETITGTGADLLTYDLTTPQFILNINGKNETLQTTISNQTDGFQMFTSSISVKFDEKTVKVPVFMVVGDSSADVNEESFITTLVPDATPYLVTVVILEILVVIFIVVLCVDKNGSGMVIHWILFISSITVCVFGFISLILISVEACKPLESIAIAAVVLSALAIPLGIAGLVLTFKWKSDNNDWIRCKQTKR